MARRPEPDYKIQQNNNSSYNILAHQYNEPTRRAQVPDTPLYTAGMGGRGDYGVGMKGYERGPLQDHKTSPRDNIDFNTKLATNMYTNSSSNLIKHDKNHVPNSPLYIEGRSPRRGGYGPADANSPEPGPASRGGMGAGRLDLGAMPTKEPDGGAEGDARFWKQEERDNFADHDDGPKTDRNDPSSLKIAGSEPYKAPNSHRGVRFDGHLPSSPFYRPGQLSQRDPPPASPPAISPAPKPVLQSIPQDEFKLNLPQSPRGDAGRDSSMSVPLHLKSPAMGSPVLGQLTDPRSTTKPEGQGRQEEPSTPNYNATHLKFDDDDLQRKSDPRLEPAGLYLSPRREHDIRDFKGNVMPARGSQTERGRVERVDMSDLRKQPWLQARAHTPGDPRMGHGAASGGFAHYQGGRNGGALLFIRFPAGYAEVRKAHQDFLMAKVHDNGGRYLGMAKKVYDFGYEHKTSDAIGMFHFPTMDKAKLFFQLDVNLRQPDFPAPYGHAQMWIICNAYLPDNMDLFNTILLSEIELHPGKDKRTFFEEFQVKFERYLYANGAMPFVVCSYGNSDRQSIRRHAYTRDVIVTCHLFQGLDHLKWMTGEEQYCKFRSLHNQMALEKCSIFTLSKSL